MDEWTLTDPIDSHHVYDAGESMAREIETRLKQELGDEVWDMLERKESYEKNIIHSIGEGW